MNPGIDWERFVLKVDEKAVIVPCLSFVLYLDLTDDAGLLDYYHRCRAALGDRITHYQAESMKGFARLNARGEAMVPTWFTQPRKGKVDYYMEMSEGDANEGVTASRIELSIYRRPAAEWSPEVEGLEVARWQQALREKRWLAPRVASMLRVTLPLDHHLAAPARLRDWVLDFQLVKAWPVFSGQVGYALNFYRQAARSSLYRPTQTLLASLCQRYPGFDWDGGGVQPRILRFQPEVPGFLPLLKRVSWLNLVCNKTMGFLGGRENLPVRLRGEQPVTVHDQEHGLAIQAGPDPQVGDLGQRDFIPAYRQVARVVRPVRIDDIDGLGAGFMGVATNEWLNAFDKDYS
jgi:hypothetical protein